MIHFTHIISAYINKILELQFSSNVYNARVNVTESWAMWSTPFDLTIPSSHEIREVNDRAEAIAIPNFTTSPSTAISMHGLVGRCGQQNHTYGVIYPLYYRENHVSAW